MQRISVSFFIVMVAFAGSVFSQGAEVRQAESPFQEEYDCELGQRLELNVQIDALILRSLRINAGDPEDFVAGDSTKAVIYLELENPNEDSASISTILLLEDSNGIQLERVELKTFKVSSEDFKEADQKVKLDGRTLQELGKIYIFAEVK